MHQSHPMLRIAPIALAVAGCSTQSPPAERPNVLLVTFDTLRADHCSSYGYERATTPELDAIAAEGLLFESCYAVMPTTAPSHATLFTSRYPDEHGVLKNGTPLPQSAVTLAEVLSEEGYQTAAFVSSYPVAAEFQLDQGFEVFDDDFVDTRSKTKGRQTSQGQKIAGDFDRKGNLTNEAALAWLASERDPDRPLFLWVHYFDPHRPHVPPQEMLEQFRPEGAKGKQLKIALYDAEVRFADECMGQIVRAVEALPSEAGNLTLITADHGEGLGDHGWWTHGVYLYEEAVVVPLVARWPGRLPENERVAGPLAQIDLMPTVLGLLGIDSGLPLGGRDASQAWRGTRRPEARPILLQRRDYGGEQDVDEFGPRHRSAARDVVGSKWALRSGRWKLIHAPEEQPAVELYDLDQDPAEAHDVADDHPDLVQELLESLRKLRASQRSALASEEPSEDVSERLRALGYTK